MDVPVDDYSKGVVFYHNPEGRIVGVLTWNLFGKMDAARKVRTQRAVSTEIHGSVPHTVFSDIIIFNFRDSIAN